MEGTTKKIRYIAPPKLYKQLTLIGFTIPELGIIVALCFSQLLAGNIANAVLFPGTFAAFLARLFDGKSMKDMLLVLFRYHIQPQQFTVHCTLSRTKKRGRKLKQ